MKTAYIEYDGQVYWLIVNGFRATFHSTYGQAERALWRTMPVEYRPAWMQQLAG